MFCQFTVDQNIILTPVVFGLEVVSSVEMLGRLVDMFVRLVDKSDVTLSNEVLITVWIRRVELSFWWILVVYDSVVTCSNDVVFNAVVALKYNISRDEIIFI